MPDAQVIEWIRDKYLVIVSDLDERGRRRWAAAEARSLGWGGITAVARATGISDQTIRHGLQELDDPDALSADRQRKPGAGLRCKEQEEPGLIDALEALLEPVVRGDPMSPLTQVTPSEQNRNDFRRAVARIFRESASSASRNGV